MYINPYLVSIELRWIAPDLIASLDFCVGKTLVCSLNVSAWHSRVVQEIIRPILERILVEAQKRGKMVAIDLKRISIVERLRNDWSLVKSQLPYVILVSRSDINESGSAAVSEAPATRIETGFSQFETRLHRLNLMAREFRKECEQASVRNRPEGERTQFTTYMVRPSLAS